jgi:hypothetical protein
MLAISTIGKLLLKQGRLHDAEILLTEALSQAQFYGNKLYGREIIAALTTLKAQKLINSQKPLVHCINCYPHTSSGKYPANGQESL